MPTYHSLGISASLRVTDLDQTLSDEIVLRMGKSLQQDTKRIQDRLSNGHALREQPPDSKPSKVGIFQFLGEDEDMVLLVVEAGNGQQQRDEGGTVEDGVDVQGELPETTNAVPTSTNKTSLPLPTPMQNIAGRKKSKRVANSQRSDLDSSKRRKRSADTPTTPFDQIVASTVQPGKSENRSRSYTTHLSDQLALCLKLDFTKFYEKDKADVPLLSGKDLKVEVFINGQLADVTYESSRPYKRSDVVQYSGTRIHRQAEKPWVYVPTTANTSDGVDSAPDQRWDNVSNLLGQEASTRGTNIWNQRPLSGQFLAALARTQLPEHVKANNQRFGIIDLIITAGTGRKYGPDTSYLTAPTRLSDKKFSGVAPVADGLGPLLDQNDEFDLQDGSSGPFDSSIDLTNFQPSQLTDDMFEMPAEQTHATASPQTPRPTQTKTARKLKAILEATPIQKHLSTYENAKGHVKGKRTLMQRFGDLSKMSPRKRREVLSSMNEVVDEDTMNKILTVFETETDETPKRVRFGDEAVINLPPTFDETADSRTSAMATDPLSQTLPQIDPSLLDDEMFASYTQLQPPTTENATDALFIDPAVLSSHPAPPKKTSRVTPASALSGSPTSTPVKYHPSHHKYDATTQLLDPLIAPVTPQQASDSPTRTRTKWIPNEQTSSQALEQFEIPDICVGSTVSYADGLKQRQISKARGGEFEEQQFVVGMRFIVL